MAIYADYTNVPDVCSVRSCRYYYPLIAYGMDAIYCHWGSDKTIALDTLNYLDIDRFDGNDNSLGYGTVFERDEERAAYYDTEHTGCLRGGQDLPMLLKTWDTERISMKPMNQAHLYSTVLTLRKNLTVQSA